MDLKRYQRKFIPVAATLSPAKDSALIVDKIRQASLITTAVWADNFRHIAPLILTGLWAQRAAGKGRINIIVCENACFNVELLKKKRSPRWANPMSMPAPPSPALPLTGWY